MDSLAALFVFSTLLQQCVAQHDVTFQAVVEQVLGESRIFSGEDVRLRCSVPDPLGSSWDYLWFKGAERVQRSGEELVLWNAHIKDSGEYYCQGVRDSAVGQIETLTSLPVEINVDGGFAILQAPPRPSLVGDTLSLTCRVRSNPGLNQLILYKDGVPVLTQKGPSPYLELPNLTLQDQGMYSCRASWNVQRVTRSVVSVETSVQVLEVLTRPVLVIQQDNNQKIRLVCQLRYNAPAPAPPIHYYFYKDDNQLGTAKSENWDRVKTSSGAYSCRARVPMLGISRQSQPTRFGTIV